MYIISACCQGNISKINKTESEIKLIKKVKKQNKNTKTNKNDKKIQLNEIENGKYKINIKANSKY